MEYCYYVYLASLEGIPRYVGLGKSNRIDHINSGTSSVRELNEQVLKFEKTFQISFLKKKLSQNQALKFEIEYILKYGRLDLGLGTLYNHTNGGIGFSGGHTKESRQKISETGKLTWKSYNHKKRKKRVNEFLKNGLKTRFKKGQPPTYLGGAPKKWDIIYPTGTCISISNLRKWCIKNKFSYNTVICRINLIIQKGKLKGYRFKHAE